MPETAESAKPAFTDEEVLIALGAPFEAHQIRTREVAKGRNARYITPRTCRERLDRVAGPANWETKVQQLGAAPGCSVICHLTVHLPSGRSITRGAVGSLPAMDSNKPLNQSKSSDSDAFKRACKMFGIGENLQDVDEFNGPARGTSAPRRDDRRTEPAAAPDRSHGGGASSGSGQSHKPPRYAKGLFPWLKNLDEHHPDGAGVFNEVENWGHNQGYPRRFSDYSEAQVAEAVAVALDFIGETQTQAQPQAHAQGAY